MTSYRSRQRHGFTLVEVVVGLTLLATVIVSSLLAFSKHQKQIRLARSKITAVEVADDLLNRMSASRTGIPSAATGPVPGHPTWSWRTSVTEKMLRNPIPMQIIKLQIIERETNSKLNLLASTSVVKAIDP
ncbi:MAG: type II secretion system GspH family protein [Rubripirellula sp.]|nr:type II secretion system GspH family protein [Rubripirellula sp.]